MKSGVLHHIDNNPYTNTCMICLHKSMSVIIFLSGCVHKLSNFNISLHTQYHIGNAVIALLLDRKPRLLSRTTPALSSTMPALSSTVPALSSTVPALSSTVPALSSTVPALSSTVPALSSTMPALSTHVVLSKFCCCDEM